MNFAKFGTNIERVAERMIINQSLDTAPSGRTLLGSDEAVMNLRPQEKQKFLGHDGTFRLKAQSGHVAHLERMKY